MNDAPTTHSPIDDYYMPPLTIENADDDGIRHLRDAIVLDAVKDYARAVYGVKNCLHEKDRKRALEYKKRLGKFFNTWWFRMLTLEQVDGDKLMEVLDHDMPLKWMTPEDREAAKATKEEKKDGKDIPAHSGTRKVRKRQQAGKDPGYKFED